VERPAVAKPLEDVRQQLRWQPRPVIRHVDQGRRAVTPRLGGERDLDGRARRGMLHGTGQHILECLPHAFRVHIASEHAQVPQSSALT
jgi:hypothetical protein